MRGAGHDAGEATAAPVIEPQWPAVSTQFGAISVPVHRNDCPNVIRATDGYEPASWPPTIASDDAGATASAALADASARRVLMERFMGATTCRSHEPCGYLRWPVNEMTCWMPLGRFVYRIVVGSRPGANLMRSALASMNQEDTSALPCAAAIASPACWNACQIVAWHAALSPLPQNFVWNGTFSGSPSTDLRSLSRSQIRPPVKPDPGPLLRPSSAFSSAPCGPSAGARIASARTGYSASQIAGPAPASALPSRLTSSRLELPVRHASSAASICASRGLGAVLPASTRSSSGVRSIDRRSCVAAAFIADVTLASEWRCFFARLPSSICTRCAEP